MESDWKTLQVKMPISNHIPFQQFWMKLFERFTNAFPILRYLLWFNSCWNKRINGEHCYKRV